MSGEERDGRIRRFTPTEIAFHWAMVVPYLVLLVTGALLLGRQVVRRFVDGDVGIEGLKDVHRWAGVALPVVLFLVVLGGDRRVLRRNLHAGLHFGVADIRWLLLLPLSTFRKGVELPPAGKFNAGQKLNFIAQTFLLPVLFVSGMFMWFVHGELLPWYVHVAAFLVLTPLVCGHMYLALLHPTTRKSLSSVWSGWVDAGWARDHHPAEYGEDPGSADA